MAANNERHLPPRAECLNIDSVTYTPSIAHTALTSVLPAFHTQTHYAGPASLAPSQQQDNSAAGTFTVSPAAPPLTDSQRARASKALARSLQLRQQRKLSSSPQLELLVVQPLSTYQQYAQGVGAFAHARIGTCQTGQLDQDLHEQDAQTEEVGPSRRCTDSCDGAAWIPPAHFLTHRYALMQKD